MVSVDMTWTYLQAVPEPAESPGLIDTVVSGSFKDIGMLLMWLIWLGSGLSACLQ